MAKQAIDPIETLQSMPPLIILGMHRSGTSLTTRLLADCCFFPGRKLSVNSESVLFRRINEKMYRQVGASWSRIDRICNAMDSHEFVSRHAGKIRDYLLTYRHIRRFFTGEHWNRLRAGELFPWCWKDPRTTITFPVWLEVFPDARFLTIRRNGIDVALSLHRRALKNNQFWKRFSPVHNFSKRMLNLKECLDLWAEHLHFELRKRVLIPKGNLLEVEYEHFLANPISTLSRILEFAGVSYQKKKLGFISAQINQKRLDNSRYVLQFKDEIEPLLGNPLLQQFGYAEKTREYFRD
jgi:hypothetical protein